MLQLSHCHKNKVNFHKFTHFHHFEFIYDSFYIAIPNEFSFHKSQGDPFIFKRVCSENIKSYTRKIDKAPCLSITTVIWIVSSDTDTICQLNQFNTNSEAAMLSSAKQRG